MKRTLFGSALLAASLLCFGPNVADAQAPGTGPKGKAVDRSAIPRAASGLKVFYRKFGKYTLSVGAKGSNDATGHTITIKKPSKDAVVDKAFLMAALWSFDSTMSQGIFNGDVRLANKKVSFFDSAVNVVNAGFYFHSVLADVTGIVKDRIDAAGKGNINFKALEVNKNNQIDGEVLAVVFKTPGDAAPRTIALMFGGQQLTGDRFEINLADPIDPEEDGARANMGLAISFSTGGSQSSSVKVNGTQVSMAAGGYDDGQYGNGMLITAGGVGDSKANPPDPNSSFSEDDEMYNLLPFITKDSKTIIVDTLNPSNDDNIFFAWFDLSTKGDVNKDTDGDGLLDSWEKNGYDHDGDGVIDVPIHQRGANWKHKDIFIAHAWMVASGTETASHKPPQESLDAVTKAFKNAPVSNPDGVNGIKVHWRSLGSVPHDDDLNEVWTEFDALMNPLVSEAERKIYRRMLSGHGYGGGTSSGIARGIPASDFVESLGWFPTNPGTVAQRAGTIMHELGHTLGLRHGGVDHENYKPNHLSVMSYLNQMSWLTVDGNPKLDYERFDIRDLDETALGEGAGLNRVGGDGPIQKYGVRWRAGASTIEKATNAHKNVDWNNSGVVDAAAVAADINASGGNTELNARFIEWDNIIYDGGEIGAGLPRSKRNLITSPKDLQELTPEMDEQIQRRTRQN